MLGAGEKSSDAQSWRWILKLEFWLHSPGTNISNVSQ